jgi:hypothetical protein
MEDARLMRPAFGQQKMEVEMKIDPVPEGLDGRDDPGLKRASGQDFEVTSQGPKGATAEIPEEQALEFEEDPQHLRDGEDDLTVRDTQKECLPHFGLPQSR